MPMVELRYKSHAVSNERAQMVGECLDDILRESIERVRPGKSDYRILVEGGPFGPVCFGQPDLRVHIFYNQEWNFSGWERESLIEHTKERLARVLSGQFAEALTVDIRIFARVGCGSVKIP